jgi:DNA-binding response OmpR family regulator
VHLVWSRNRLLAASAVVVICTGVAAGLFLHAYATLARTSFRERTAAYAEAFAANAESWLARGQVDVVQTLARFLVSGSVLAVEVAGPDGEVLREGREIAAAADAASAGTVVVRRASGGVEYLDVIVPMSSTGGRVRMAVDTASAESAVRQAALLGGGGAALFDAGVIGVLAWALRARRRTSEDVPTPSAECGGEIAVGDLVISPARCEVSFAGRPLRLTPKQFALLGVLASQPGRVFSEAEILARAWPDSPYADARDIKQYIYLLRRRLSEIRPDGRDVIVTVPGFGYRLDDGR